MNLSCKGVGVAIVTPFDVKYKIDYPALSRIIEHLINGDVDYIVSLGTTGEAITLTEQECRDVLDFTMKQVNGRVPIVAGQFGSNDTEAIVRKIKNYNFDGLAGILSSSPSYNKPSQEGIFQHYQRINEVTPVPVILYNVPGRTSSNVEADTVLRIARNCPNIIAVKDASANMIQAMQELQDKPDTFSLLSGDDPTSLPLLLLGGSGVISVIGNLYPHIFTKMVHLAIDGKRDEARHYNEIVIDVHQWLYKDGSPSGIKAAMHIAGFCENVVRLPLVPIHESTYAGLKNEMQRVNQLLLELA